MKLRFLAGAIAMGAALVVGAGVGSTSLSANAYSTSRTLSTPAPLLGTWHRLSEDRSHPAPEHERLACWRVSDDNEGGGGGDWFDQLPWRCHYDKVKESGLNFYWNTNQGFFRGADVTAGWACPAWFPTGICQHVTRVVEGVIVFVDPGVHKPFPVLVDLVVTQTQASQILQLYWVNQFVCPWYRTFAEALSANPFPLPFDGTNWPAQSCTNAP